MFSPRDAHAFFTLLLETTELVSCSKVAWYTNRVQQPSSGIPTQLLLDLNSRGTEGTIVPQRRWIPDDGGGVRRHVQRATLQLPIFFVKRNDAVGFWLPDILEGSDTDLYNRDEQAPLGGRTTTQIRINVSSPPYLTANDFHPFSSTPFQWPGYEYWKCQIRTRDETYLRSPITVGRFMKHVGTSVNNFINVSFLLLRLSSVTDRAPPLLALLSGWPWDRSPLVHRARRHHSASCQGYWCCTCICR